MAMIIDGWHDGYLAALREVREILNRKNNEDVLATWCRTTEAIDALIAKEERK